MKLPDQFSFSQGSLQDYVDCRRRFYLRYIQRLAWPAVQVEPALENERHMLLGARFHRMVHQHLTGIPAQQLKPDESEEKLTHWWNNYLASINHLPVLDEVSLMDHQLFPEIILSATIGIYRLVAKYDLIAVTKDRQLVIFDWKTATRRPKRNDLAARLQTQIYPYLLVQAGQYLNANEPVHPEKVAMMYWFAGFPHQPEYFHYNTTAHERTTSMLGSLITEIEQLEPNQFDLTENERLCEYCQYRSLCRRGISAGILLGEDADELAEIDLEIDLTTIAEIGYD